MTQISEHCGNDAMALTLMAGKLWHKCGQNTRTVKEQTATKGDKDNLYAGQVNTAANDQGQGRQKDTGDRQ